MKLYPIECDLKFHITDGVTVGSVTYGHGVHRLPTEDQMADSIAKIMPMLPEGFRLMSRQESTMYFLREKRGYRGPLLAFGKMDEGEEWHDPATENTFSTLFDNGHDDEDELHEH